MTSWNNDLEGYENRAEADAALEAAKTHAPRSGALLLKLVEGCWTELDDEGEAEAYEITDASGAFSLWPEGEADEDDLDDLDIEAVPGHVWVFCR